MAPLPVPVGRSSAWRDRDSGLIAAWLRKKVQLFEDIMDNTPILQYNSAFTFSLSPSLTRYP